MSRSLSRQQLHRLGEPFGDSATYATVTGKRIYGGGGSGGGSGQRDATMEERRLWDAQASSLEQMSAVAMPMLTTGMGNMGVMANEAMDGTLSTRLRNMAGVDAAQAMGQGLSAASRGLERYGSTMNPNALGATMNAAGLEGAKMKSNAMNMANTAAEDVKWQRNAALTSLASGQGSSSVSGMGSLAGQIGQSRQASNAAAANEQASNNQALAGLGMGLAQVMKADGGEIRLASGGGVQSFQRPSSFQSAPRVGGFDSTKEDEDGGGIMATLQPVLTPLAIQEAGKVVVPAVKGLMGGGAGLGSGLSLAGSAGVGAGSVGTGIVGGTSAAAGMGGSLGGGLSLASAGGAGMGGGALGAGIGGGTAATGAAAGTAAGGAAAGGAAGAAGAGAAAGTGAAAGAAATGAAGTAAATNAWNPVGWAAAAYLAGSALDLWADGGDVGERKDMRPGGHVRGPGTETSDSIPALLSNNEFVNNADSVKLPRKESKQVVQTWLEEGGTTKELLNEINNAGLRKRGKPPQPIAESKNGEVRALSGGLAALGHIARGYVPAAMDIDHRKKQEKRIEDQQAENTRRWDAQNAREDEKFSMMKNDREAQKAAAEGVRAAFREATENMTTMSGFVDQLKQGKVDSGTFVSTLAPHAKQMGMEIKQAPGGKFVVNDQKGGQSVFKNSDELATYMSDPAHAQRVMQDAYLKAAQFDPAMAGKAMELVNARAKDMRDEKEFEFRKWQGEQANSRGWSADGRAAEAHRYDIEEKKYKAEAEKEVRDLRKSLATATDEGERAAIRQRIEDIAGGARPGGYKVGQDAGAGYLINEKTGDAIRLRNAAEATSERMKHTAPPRGATPGLATAGTQQVAPAARQQAADGWIPLPDKSGNLKPNGKYLIGDRMVRISPDGSGYRPIN